MDDMDAMWDSHHRWKKLTHDFAAFDESRNLEAYICTKLTNYVIAVRHHDATTPEELQDYLLIKATRHVTVEKVKRAYIETRRLGDDVANRVVLKLGQYVPDADEKMVALNRCRDRYVVLEAELLKESGATSVSSPETPIPVQPSLSATPSLAPPTSTSATPSPAQSTGTGLLARAAAAVVAGTGAQDAAPSVARSSLSIPRTSFSPHSETRPSNGGTQPGSTKPSPAAPATPASFVMTPQSMQSDRVPLQPTDVHNHFRQGYSPYAPPPPMAHGYNPYAPQSMPYGAYIKPENYGGAYPMNQLPNYGGNENAPYFGPQPTFGPPPTFGVPRNFGPPPTQYLMPAGQVSSFGSPSQGWPQHPVPVQHPVPIQHPAGIPPHNSVHNETIKAEDVNAPDVMAEDAVDSQESKAIHLQELLKETTPEKLEQGVQKGLQLLECLEKAFGALPNQQESQDWVNSIASIRKDATPTRTVVGVVGNTGAGKSALLNALLDEERLLPTNCMRACTAVVTEISWNDSDEFNSKYRAEIEYIKPEEWQKELEVLFEDLLDGNGNISREVNNPDSDAGVAYAKIRAVYYKHTREDLASSSVESLMKQQHVQNVLGTTQRISEPTCPVFYKRLQQIVDSKEKSDSIEEESGEENEKDKDKDKGNDKKNRKRVMEFWPLIKVVRIYAKSDALSTGAVVVDLPGVHDSNAARAAVADGYMKQCTGLWIVAPITRAVDDKAAKNLLGDVFRRQLKFDGTYSAVTFICSKSDDISLTEATDSLAIGEEMNELEAELRQVDLERRSKKKLLRDLRDEKSACQETADDADEQQELWDQLQEDLDSGKTVYAPPTKKRKRDDSEDRMSDHTTPPTSQKTPLTEDDIETRLSELKATKRSARRQRTELTTKIEEVNSDLEKLSARSDEIESKRSILCIAGRNEYSKSAIRVDFAAGIKELDQENQADEDPDAFDPDEEIRDYEEVARSLPVFCVSSRAYQKLSGRLLKDNDVKGFTSVDQTEIPALQRHAKKLTEGTRASACRRFLNGLSQLCNSLSLWASDNGSGALTGSERDLEQRYLLHKLGELEKALDNCMQTTFLEVKDTLRENIFEHYGEAVRLASDAALPTSSGWGAHRSEGGLYWATYKATVRRDGVYAGASGVRDFNSELSEPLYKHLGSGWEKAFQRKLPTVLKECAKTFSESLRAFHKDLEERARKLGVAVPRLALLSRQLETWESVMVDVANTTVSTINDRQKEINREFTPAITEAMQRAYVLTTEERGPGSYARMKAAMHDEVEGNKDTMFKRACERVEAALNESCLLVKKWMGERVQELFTAMRRDYIRVLGNGQGDLGAVMPREQRLLRREVVSLVTTSDKAFKDVIDGVEGDGDA